MKPMHSCDVRRPVSRQSYDRSLDRSQHFDTVSRSIPHHPSKRKPDPPSTAARALRNERCSSRTGSLDLRTEANVVIRQSSSESFQTVNTHKVANCKLSRNWRSVEQQIADSENLTGGTKYGRQQHLKDNARTHCDSYNHSDFTRNSAAASASWTLKDAIRAEKDAIRSLKAELDEERSASSTAACEAMSMITRLQEEKAAVLMEASQFKRMAEEREVHNQEAISLLKEMLIQKEEESSVLQNELSTYRDIHRHPVQDCPVLDYPVQECTGNFLIEDGRSSSDQNDIVQHCNEGIEEPSYSRVCQERSYSRMKQPCIPKMSARQSSPRKGQVSAPSPSKKINGSQVRSSNLRKSRDSPSVFELQYDSKNNVLRDRSSVTPQPQKTLIEGSKGTDKQNETTFMASPETPNSVSCSVLSSKHSSNGKKYDAMERVHDIYEVDSYENRKLQDNSFTDFSEEYKSGHNQKPDSPLEMSTPDYQIESQAFLFTPQVLCSRSTTSTESSSELGLLKMRLQALEDERQSMNQAITSLKKENEELKVLQEILQELDDLKRTMQKPDSQLQCTGSSLFSRLKGFFSNLIPISSFQRHKTLENEKLYNSHSTKSAPTGLSYLLQKSPCSRDESLTVRSLSCRAP